MFFEVAENGKIMICAEEKLKSNMIELVPPEEFSPDEMHDWLVLDGELVYSPLPVKDPEPTDKERITALEEQIDMLLSGVTSDE